MCCAPWQGTALPGLPIFFDSKVVGSIAYPKKNVGSLRVSSVTGYTSQVRIKPASAANICHAPRDPTYVSLSQHIESINYLCRSGYEVRLECSKPASGFVDFNPTGMPMIDVGILLSSFPRGIQSQALAETQVRSQYVISTAESSNDMCCAPWQGTALPGLPTLFDSKVVGSVA